MMKKVILILSLLCIPFISYSQYSLGGSGLMNVPSADMHEDGTFTVGGNYLPKTMLPGHFRNNTGNYFVNLTFLPFVEMSYRCTLQQIENEVHKKSWQQDRSVSLKLRVLKEKKYVPAIAFGSNDVFTTYQLNMFSDKGDNRFFASVYGAVTKNLPIGSHYLGVTSGYYIPVRKQKINEGVFGGIRYIPGFFPQMELIAEYGGEKVNAGVACLLFNHVRLHLFTYGFEAVSGGIRYEFKLFH